MLTTFTVTNLNDAPLSGPDSQTGTLRWAISEANDAPDADLIEFSPELSGSIQLSILGDVDPTAGASAIEIHSPITIRGNGNPIDITRAATATDRRLFRVATNGDLTLEMLTLRGGTARGNPGSPGQDGTPGLGGAVYNQGTLRIFSSTLHTNSAIGGNAGAGGTGGVGFGGAIYNDAGNVVIRNSTLSGNSVSGGSGTPAGAAFGGSIYSRNGSLTVHNSTLTSSSAVSGRELYVIGIGAGQTAVAEVYSSIIARDNSTPGLDFNATDDLGGQVLVTGANNLIRWHTVNPSMIITSDDPKLGSLESNGGPTWTHELLPDSPAIGLGSNVLNLDADQRGGAFDRVVGSAPDIGAFEVQTPGQALPGDYNGSDLVDAADYVIWRKTLGNNVERFSGADGNGNEAIDVIDYEIWRGNFGAAPASGSGPVLAFVEIRSSNVDSGAHHAGLAAVLQFGATKTVEPRDVKDAVLDRVASREARDLALLNVVGYESLAGKSRDVPVDELDVDTERTELDNEAYSLDDAAIQSPLQMASPVAASNYTA